ncbi:MAG: catalase [Pirellulales bacterium]
MSKSRKSSSPKSRELDAKAQDLEYHVEIPAGHALTTNQGVRISDDQNSLKTGPRGSTLLEDFVLREKITHFDHERIPERIVHARGSGAHGYFECEESMTEFTRAAFLQTPGERTPVFVRFSTVAGSRGSSDLAHDVRGFAIKFYTNEGNYDLVGNNMPVFFIQDAMKFPDLIHAVKPEPHNEIPQAASAHDTFWDFISLMPEAMHMIMWVMSDRAIPRSLRMMQGFGVHTFRFVNGAGKSVFVKYHLKPKLGSHAVLWDEALRISGCDPDFHRRDLWEAIENGMFPEWEFGVQIVPEKDEHKFDFDLLDPTKLIPEELVPVRRIGKLVLNRNPDNFFAETEQVAFQVGSLVPGIDFTNDPLLQGRTFSYTDTQLIRLGGPNFHEIPINRPIVPTHNLQRDGHMRQTINRGRVAYEPNTLGGNDPHQTAVNDGGFASYAERIDGSKIRARSKSFSDHFSQAAMFFHSQTPVEQSHIVDALRFELGKVETSAIRERMVFLLSQVDRTLAQNVAEGLGIDIPKSSEGPLNLGVPADGAKDQQPKKFTGKPVDSPSLSMLKNNPATPEGRKVAALVAEGFDGDAIAKLKKGMLDAGVQLKIVAPRGGSVVDANGKPLAVDHGLNTVASVLFDAVVLGGGDELSDLPKAIEFVEETFKYLKPIAALSSGVELLKECRLGKTQPELSASNPEQGLLIGQKSSNAAKLLTELLAALGQHRVWERAL